MLLNSHTSVPQIFHSIVFLQNLPECYITSVAEKSPFVITTYPYLMPTFARGMEAILEVGMVRTTYTHYIKTTAEPLLAATSELPGIQEVKSEDCSSIGQYPAILHAYQQYLALCLCSYQKSFIFETTGYTEIFVGDIFCGLYFRGVKFSGLKPPPKIGRHQSFATLTVCSMERWLMSSRKKKKTTKNYAWMNTTFTMYWKLLLEKCWFAWEIQGTLMTGTCMQWRLRFSAGSRMMETGGSLKTSLKENNFRRHFDQML